MQLHKAHQPLDVTGRIQRLRNQLAFWGLLVSRWMQLEDDLLVVELSYWHGDERISLGHFDAGDIPFLELLLNRLGEKWIFVAMQAARSASLTAADEDGIIEVVAAIVVAEFFDVRADSNRVRPEPEFTATVGWLEQQLHAERGMYDPFVSYAANPRRSKPLPQAMSLRPI